MTAATELMTRQEAADYLRVHVATVDRLARRQEIRVTRARGMRTVRFRRSELDRFIERNTREWRPRPKAKGVHGG